MIFVLFLRIGSSKQIHTFFGGKRDEQATQMSGFRRNFARQSRPGRKADEERHRGLGHGQVRSVRDPEGRGQTG